MIQVAGQNNTNDWYKTIPLNILKDYVMLLVDSGLEAREAAKTTVSKIGDLTEFVLGGDRYTLKRVLEKYFKVPPEKVESKINGKIKLLSQEEYFEQQLAHRGRVIGRKKKAGKHQRFSGFYKSVKAFFEKTKANGVEYHSIIQPLPLADEIILKLGKTPSRLKILIGENVLMDLSLK